jgi:hypothetical protein
LPPAERQPDSPLAERRISLCREEGRS